MRILFLTRIFPYPMHSGDLIYSARLIEALAMQPTFEVTVFCSAGFSAPPKASRAKWTGVAGLPSRKTDIKALFGKLPRAAQRAFPTAARTALSQLLTMEQFDLAIVNEAAVAPAVTLLNRHAIPVFYISHNVDSDIRPAIAAKNSVSFMRFLQMVDARKYRDMELDLLRRVRGLSVISRADEARFKELAPKLDSILVTPGFSYDRATTLQPMADRSRVAVLVGSFQWNAKIANLKEILVAWSVYRKSVNNANFRLRIAGRAAPGLFKKLAALYPDVEFLDGFVDLRDVVHDARIGLVLESMGGGFKLKTLDYISSDLAILAYPHALAGSGFIAGTDFIDAMDPTDSMKKIADNIEDVSSLAELAARARQRALKAGDWTAKGAELSNFLTHLIS